MTLCCDCVFLGKKLTYNAENSQKLIFVPKFDLAKELSLMGHPGDCLVLTPAFMLKGDSGFAESCVGNTVKLLCNTKLL